MTKARRDLSYISLVDLVACKRVELWRKHVSANKVPDSRFRVTEVVQLILLNVEKLKQI